jgi:predicted molibdopterin-dependent oxidoreductase YjgC
VPAELIRGAARLYATGGNGAIYYGLGVTEHSQGSTTVMAIANLAMATGNIGREGVGVNPLRGQNNVQGSCDMGSFPHEVSGYRHISEDVTRAMFEALWGRPLDAEPGLRIPNMIDAAVDGSFKGLYIQGEDILQSDPNTQHMAAGLAAMECVVVQDLFYVATDEKTGPRYPLLLTTGRILSQYNVGAQTRRTANVIWHEQDRLEIHPHDAEQRGVRDGDWVKLSSRAGETTLRALITERVAPGVVYTTFHHPDTQVNVVTTEFSDWATNCPEYKVTAVQVMPSNGPSEWQEEYEELTRQSRRIAEPVVIAAE